MQDRAGPTQLHTVDQKQQISRYAQRQSFRVHSTHSDAELRGGNSE
jgi:hypothetical protein